MVFFQVRTALTILTFSMGKPNKAGVKDRPPFQGGCPQIPLWNGLTDKPRSGLTSLGGSQIWDGGVGHIQLDGLYALRLSLDTYTFPYTETLS